MRKTLIAFRLFNSTYGPTGNPASLFVNLREDNTLSYVFIQGWQSSGMGYSISNLQLRESLPLGARPFKTVKALQKRIAEVLATGCGSNKIKTFEILNDLNTVSSTK
jgi:hypothetical protein